MPKVASVIAWETEPFAQIKEAIESCSLLAQSISESRLAGEGYSYFCVLATADRVVPQHAELEEWLQTLPASLNLKVSVAEQAFATTPS
jgi:hypothetical protein